METTSIIITVLMSVLGGACITLLFLLKASHVEVQHLKYLVKANYKESCDDYYAPDGWSTGSLPKAARRAKLELEIKEFKLEIPVDEYLNGKEMISGHKEAVKSVDKWLSKK